MKPRFKVGDKVRILDGSKIEDYVGGWYGTMKKYIDKVFTVDSVHPWWGINRTPAYALEGSDFIWDERGLERVDDKHIEITAHGKNVFAKIIEGNKVVRTGVARCSPEDEFNFETGAKIAFERLFPKKFDWEAFKLGEFAVALNTRRKYDDFMKLCKLHGIKWRSGCEADKNDCFTKHEEDTAVCCFDGDRVLEYSNVDYYKGNGITIINFNSCMFDDEIKVDDMVKVTDTTKCYACSVQWVVEHIENKILIARYAYGKPLKSCDDNRSFKVHLIADNKAYIFNADGFDKACYLVDIDALEKL